MILPWGLTPQALRLRLLRRLNLQTDIRARGEGDSLHARCIVRRIQFHSPSRIEQTHRGKKPFGDAPFVSQYIDVPRRRLIDSP